MATARTSLKLRRFRRRFGISAPKLAIGTHVEWRWRFLAAVTAVLGALGLSAAAYEFGQRASGAPGDNVGQVRALQQRVSELEDEASRLRSAAGAGESSLQIERVAQQQLTKQVRALEAENSALRDDLAFFEGLIPASESAADVSVRIHRLRVEPDASTGQYRYRMLLVNNGGKPQKEFRGTLQLLVKVQRPAGDAMITIPSGGEPDVAKFRIEIKHFQRIEGSFSVPAGNAVKSVEARLMQDGEVRARQSVTL
ncbi:DUF6776 family protein [Rhodocyclus tenuis]|uniref:DUF6776 family protein n=1 Tax=Rhodocyclus tenuis TaxID=1066 RepID=UPI00190743E4|nr:DUF6776 family protein [Rhodocyclus tenuis]